ncbi:MAG: glycine cleavage system transcriptional repressor [Nitrospirae bacterium]|nr:MAG: glycine cleavage system transcriptional repressor [Nitrospirota bacterium]
MGPDRPGIIAAVSKTLFEYGCNLEDVSQTILQSSFVGIFIGTIPEILSEEAVLAALQADVEPMGLAVHLSLTQEPAGEPTVSESFVITTVGSDRPGLVAGVAEILAKSSVNITNLKAVFRGTKNPNHNVMIYEVDIPQSLDQHSFRTALYNRAHELGLDISLQHREIFEQIHRV